MIDYLKKLIEEGNIFGAMGIILGIEIILLYIMYQLITYGV